MSNLFETGVNEWPPKQIMADVLIKAREEIGKGEDDWVAVDTCRAMQMLPAEYQPMVAGIDPMRFKNYMQRLRKDKVVPKVKPPKNFTEKVKKILRDFEKNRQREGSGHLSDEYIEYVIYQSPEWIEKAREHKDRCNWRCQLCGRESSNLEVHHTRDGYINLGCEKPWHLLALCGDPCHPVADMLRSGWLHEHGNDYSGFFSEDDIPE